MREELKKRKSIAMSSNTYQQIALILLVLCIVSPIESRYENKKQEKSIGTQQSTQPQLTVPQTTLSLCKKDRTLSFLCHCTPDDESIKAQKADCWIISPEITRKDQQWLAFNSQTQLQHLKFSVFANGNLSFVPTDILQPLKHLRTINIEFGHIDKLNGFAFGNLTQLMNISMANNHVKSIEANAFANHPHLHEINLEKNEIYQIDQKAFVNVPNLNRLNFDHNRLEVIQDDTFEALTKLSELLLRNNSIIKLTRGIFKGLGNLKVLNLSNNKLNFIGDTVFAELWSLQELELEHNQIDKISERAFDGLNNLQRLNLESNNLKLLERGLFTGVPALIYLNLMKNSLETITYNNILPLMDNLVNNTNSILDITENKFVCDCRMSWLFDLKIQTKNEDLRLSLDDIECSVKKPKDSFHKLKDSYNHKTHRIDHNNIERTPAEEHTLAEEEEEPEYYDDEPEGRIVNLMDLKPNNLTCPEEASDPTELPLSRESIGFDMSWVKFHADSTSASSSTCLPLSISLLLFIVFKICNC